MKLSIASIQTLRLTLPLLAILTGGCAGMQPVTPEAPPAPEPGHEPSPRVIHNAPTSNKTICGTLFNYALDIHRLNGQQQYASLDKVATANSPQYFCDTVKTGILLSQISRTVSEDDVAISILNEYSKSEKLSKGERWLLRLLKNQSEERRRLHVLLDQFSEKLVAQETLATTLSSELLTVRQQLYQLKKIEADINETQQSIATPAAPADKQTTEDPGS